MSGLDLRSQPGLDTQVTRGRFTGQVVIVTGGAGGIGGAIVHRFLSDGAKVAILDMNEEAAAAKIREISDAGVETDVSDKYFDNTIIYSMQGRVKYFKINVTSRSECFRVVTDVVSVFGKVHHLVNCVAYFGSESLLATEQDWDRTMRVNVAGSSFMVQAVTQVMQEYSRNENCSVVNISSISAHQTQPNRWTYAASKVLIMFLSHDQTMMSREL